MVEVVGIAGRELGFSMAGLDAYAGYCLAAGSFLAMAYALRRGDHIRVTLILSRLKGRTRYWMEVLCLAVAALLSAYFAWFAAKLVWGSYAYHDVSQNVDATPLWIPQLSMALGAVRPRGRLRRATGRDAADRQARARHRRSRARGVSRWVR